MRKATFMSIMTLYFLFLLYHFLLSFKLFKFFKFFSFNVFFFSFFIPFYVLPLFLTVGRKQGVDETANATCGNGLYGHDMQARRRATWLGGLISIHFACNNRRNLMKTAFKLGLMRTSFQGLTRTSLLGPEEDVVAGV
jgi:hypothetical protein